MRAKKLFFLITSKFFFSDAFTSNNAGNAFGDDDPFSSAFQDSKKSNDGFEDPFSVLGTTSNGEYLRRNRSPLFKFSFWEFVNKQKLKFEKFFCQEDENN